MPPKFTGSVFELVMEWVAEFLGWNPMHFLLWQVLQDLFPCLSNAGRQTAVPARMNQNKTKKKLASHATSKTAIA